MAHTDLHAKTEAQVDKAQAASKQTYQDQENGPAKPTKPDETQTLRDCPKYNTAYKGALTGSIIYERMLQDKKTGALRIDGPADGGAFMAFHSSGSITLRTGERNPDNGSDSGMLHVRTNGQIQIHEEFSYIQYNKGGTEGAGEALNIMAYGDVTENAYGSQRTIKAKKIIIKATEELVLQAGTQVFIQAGGEGGGTIRFTASNVEKVTNNDKEIILGQKMTYGVSEDTKMQFDPRASVTINSTGLLNFNVLGAVDWKVGGAYNMDIGGLYANKVGGSASINAGGAANLTAGAALALTAAGKVVMVSVEDTNIRAGKTVTVDATAGNVEITAKTDVNIKGALIKLN